MAFIKIQHINPYLFTFGLENHRTQTRYDDALIIKLFAFQFANSYASCFYIAFFRGVSICNTEIIYIDAIFGYKLVDT